MDDRQWSVVGRRWSRRKEQTDGGRGLSGRVLLGGGNGRLSDRGRSRRGWARREYLGPVLAYARQDAERRYRRRRVRPLPSLPGGRGAHGAPRPEDVSIFDRVA